MSLKVLHTADWHLGHRLYGNSREPEHSRFMSWLTQTLVEREVDVLVIAGDLFDQASPPADAQRLYYDFLAEASRLPNLRSVVLTGGNHDAAARLDAARELLARLKIHVVGGITINPDTWERALCPVYGDSGDIEGVFVAVPYIHEYKLGVQSAGRTPGEVAVDIERALTTLYRELAELAASRYPGVPLVATGHLTAQNAADQELGPCPYPVHLPVERGLNGSIFDPRYAYVGLGHIHKSYRVAGPSNAWYSGSPVPFSVIETAEPRQVKFLELGEDPDARPAPERIVVPEFRRIVRLTGEREAIEASLESLEWDNELPAWVYAEVNVNHHQNDLKRSLLQIVDAHPKDHRPQLVRLTQVAAVPEEPPVPVRLDSDYSDDEIFRLFVKARTGFEPDGETMLTFRTAMAEILSTSST